MRCKGLMAFALIPLLSVQAAAQSVTAGIEAWQRGSFPAAVKIWRPLAENGDPDAAFNLGQAYRLGRGVPINLAAAQTWLARAADKDHLDAQSTLGLLLFDNGDRAGGIRWLKVAADRGEPRAMLVYGTALFNGDGVVRDPVRAYAYVSRAAAQRLAPARRTLADIDKLLPVAQRRTGVAMAIAMTRVAPAPAAAKARSAVTPAATVTRAPAKIAAAPAMTSGGWRIQLGAFSHRSSAEALFRKLAGQPALAGRQPSLVPAGAVTRLQVGPYPSRAAAAAACAALAKGGQPCFPVAAR